MAQLKNLVKDTAIYGISSIVGRFLNYLLVPIYAASMSAASGGYGVVTEVYAWTALLMVILTYGMETTLFRFLNKEGEDPARVYATTLYMVGGSSLLFALLALLFLPQLAGVMGYSDHPWYVGMMALVVAMDAFQSMLFAHLRYQKRPIRFATIKLTFILLNILLNTIYYVAMGQSDVFYAFFFNLVCTSVVMLLLLPQIKVKVGFDKRVATAMLRYATPILLLGIAGILNQVIDKIIFRHFYPDAALAKSELAIYGASSKIAMIMAMLTQAFRYAYEPFVFGSSKEKGSVRLYAAAMKYFIIFTLLAFLVVMFYLDVLKYILAPDYWSGLRVVPIVMAAEIFMGIYFNLSFWYKLSDDTRWGAYFSLAGCLVLVLINVLLIPRYGYMACAWAGFAGYGVAMLLSYFVGQRKYPIPYDLRSIGKYVVLAMVLFGLGNYLPIENKWLLLALRSALLLLFVVYIVKHDLPVSRIPVLNRLFRK